MKSSLHADNPILYRSVHQCESRVLSGVSYSVRKPSLAQRIELSRQTQDLLMKHEFLRAGDVSDQISANLAELYVKALYLKWGLVELTGLLIDGESPNTENLIKAGPEDLVEEILEEIKRQAELSEDERKNS